MKILCIIPMIYLLMGCNPNRVFYYKRDTHRKYKDLLLHTESAKHVEFVEVEELPVYANTISFDDHLTWEYGDDRSSYTKIFYFIFDLKKDIHIKTSSWTLDNRIKMMNTINKSVGGR